MIYEKGGIDQRFQLHNLGLKLGIYEDYGTKTCGGYPGSYGFLEIDANTFAEWKVDYLKLDGCNIEPDKYPIGYPAMEHYLNVSGRPIAYSCSWPAYLIDQPDKVDQTFSWLLMKQVNYTVNYNYERVNYMVNYTYEQVNYTQIGQSC